MFKHGHSEKDLLVDHLELCKKCPTAKANSFMNIQDKNVSSS